MARKDLKVIDTSWTPGCGRPHPNFDLILMWASGQVETVAKQRVDNYGRPYSGVVRAQYPCWNPQGWTFDVAPGSQIGFDFDPKTLPMWNGPRFSQQAPA